MKPIQVIGVGVGSASLVALLLLSLGVDEAFWCPATGVVATGGEVSSERPWELSDGSQTLQCEVSGIRYGWQVCTAESCQGVVQYCQRIMTMDGQARCID